MDDAPVLKVTGKSLGEWFEILDERGARALSHKEIARLLHEDHGVPGWWCQSVTVEYEKHIGRRETGQRQSGQYTTTASRTLPGTMDEALDRWLARLPAADEGPAFDGVPFAGEPSISRTPKWRYWRVGLADGAKVTVSISAKPGGKAALLAVETDKLAGKADIERWKAYWKAYLAEI
jgi:hypothetical protein